MKTPQEQIIPSNPDKVSDHNHVFLSKVAGVEDPDMGSVNPTASGNTDFSPKDLATSSDFFPKDAPNPSSTTEAAVDPSLAQPSTPAETAETAVPPEGQSDFLPAEVQAEDNK